MNLITQSFQYGDEKVTLETGRIARQANGAVLVRTEGGTSILATVVGAQNSNDSEYKNFLPLTVNYLERTYAMGKIPGSFPRREGRPTLRETLKARLIDRVLRPSFPEGFTSEVQVITMVMSLDKASNPGPLSIIGASAALAISDIPFSAPVAAARVGYSDGRYLFNPSFRTIQDSQLDLVVGANEKAVLMVESSAKELTEEVMLEAVLYGHKNMQPAIEAINRLVEETGKSTWEWMPATLPASLIEQVKQEAGDRIEQAYAIADKVDRQRNLHLISKSMVEKFCQTSDNDESDIIPNEAMVLEAIHTVEKQHVRTQLLAGKPRIDGRDLQSVRPIHIELGHLKRAHGSAIFTRGETQALVVMTLGTDKDAQIIDDLSELTSNRFMLHYNFLPFSVGEISFLGSPKRREIGHGSLAKRALLAVLPDEADFPYVVRLVSEITESNGSSSMATVCGASLALMDGGFPLKEPVAGIAMGLIKASDDEEGEFVVLSDILGDEDHYGDMDFKVAGTLKGITALQMDIKISGLTPAIIEKALEQAKAGRHHILKVMSQSIREPRAELAEHAPRFLEFQINTDKIRDVIGKGGATIREITDKAGVVIDVADNGTIRIASSDQSAAELAKKLIQDVIREVEVGEIFTGKVVKLMDFGAFVSLLPNKDGFLHISEICQHRVNNIRDELVEGQEVTVKVVEVDRQKNRVRLSMKNVKSSNKETLA